MNKLKKALELATKAESLVVDIQRSTLNADHAEVLKQAAIQLITAQEALFRAIEEIGNN